MKRAAAIVISVIYWSFIAFHMIGQVYDCIQDSVQYPCPTNEARNWALARTALFGTVIYIAVWKVVKYLVHHREARSASICSSNAFQAMLLSEAKEVLGASATIRSDQGAEGDILVLFGDYQLWIYDDGANILGPATDRRFENYDFDSLDDLRQAVLQSLHVLQMKSA